MWPQTRECTMSKGFVAYISTSLPKFYAYCLSFMHALQTNVLMGRKVLSRFMPLTMFYMHKRSSHSNVRVSNAKAPLYHLLYVNA